MKKFLKVVALTLALATCAPMAYIQANAGTSGTHIENGKVYEGETLSIVEWEFDKNAGISLDSQAEEPALVFHTSKVGKVLTNYTSAVTSEEVEQALFIDFTISFSDIVSGNKFGFVFGSPKLMLNGSDGIKEKDTTFLWFEKKDEGFVYGFTTYAEEEKALVAETAITGVENGVKVSMVVTHSGKVTLTLNDTIAYQSAETGEVNGNGFVGFAHMGKRALGSTKTTDARVTGLRILNEYYAKPENPVTTRETFSNNEFNTEEWTLISKSAYKGGIFAKDDALVFDHVGSNSVFATNHKYSNFQIEVDVRDVKHESFIAPDGKTVDASAWCGIEFGRDADSANDIAAENWAQLLCFDPVFDADRNHGNSTRMSFVSGQTKTETGSIKDNMIISGLALPDKYAFMNRGFTDTVRIKVSVIDGDLKVYFKLADEYEWFLFYEYTFDGGYTPYGFVSLRGLGNQFVANRTTYLSTSVTWDNVTVMNFDANPKKVEVGFTSNVIEPTKHYEYIDTWTDDYLIANTKGKGTKNAKGN
jgi:hypothetical protein